MFTILNDTIYYKGEAFATVRSDARSTLIAFAQEAIEDALDWQDAIDEHEKEINEAYRKGYQEATDRYENEYERGYDKALSDMKEFSEAS